MYLCLLAHVAHVGDVISNLNTPHGWWSAGTSHHITLHRSLRCARQFVVAYTWAIRFPECVFPNVFDYSVHVRLGRHLCLCLLLCAVSLCHPGVCVRVHSRASMCPRVCSVRRQPPTIHAFVGVRLCVGCSCIHMPSCMFSYLWHISVNTRSFGEVTMTCIFPIRWRCPNKGCVCNKFVSL